MKTTLHTALALFLLAGCSGSTSITGPDGTSTDGSKGGGNGVIEGNPAAPLTQDVCASAAAQNRPAGPRPVDIIFVIDNSGSMTSEIQEVERNINVNFAQIIQASGVDYRVILIAKHGSATVD
ncbi:MAG: hypothetical protein ACT4TC_10010, partial [Myxococcaceae bacterium]